MFTGIIEEIGTVKRINKNPKSVSLTIQASLVLEDTKIGDSIATNGICLTVTDLMKDGFSVDVMLETLNRSQMKTIKEGDKLNLERALTLNTRLGGHMVSGHVDGVGTITKIKREDIAHIYTISAEEKVLRYIIEKGSVALDGISLTVIKVSESDFSVSIIPHTKDQTTLFSKKISDKINIEVDMIGKYVEKLIKTNPDEKKSSISESMLRQYGF
ncbi:MAG: riboflavin synthase [Candidatus Izemoplasmatales bacterium]